MKIESVEKMANELIQKHLSVEAIREFYDKNDFPRFRLTGDIGIVEFLTEDWEFEIYDSRKDLAETNCDTATISMSSAFIRTNRKADVYEVLMHEIAHALCPMEGHGWMWEKICELLGIEPVEQYVLGFSK